jgi:hypothetical protein
MVRTVQITLAGLCDAAAALLLVLLEHVDLLQSLHDLAVDAAAAGNVVRGARATVLGNTVHLPQTADTDRLAEVDMAGDRGGADVEPVDLLGRELLGDTSLDRVNPAYTREVQRSVMPDPGRASSRGKGCMVLTRNWQLALSLQESGIRIDELVRLQIETPCISNHSVVRSLSTPSRLLSWSCILISCPAANSEVRAATICRHVDRERPGIRLQRSSS